ncbi:MAG: peptidoglycan DD-metalloendopeptidase family protein [Bacteroidota bacterium]|nr:peptidoglycan DD-metalloendopeptidase family protein [Bacteroidota bacterium]
MKTLFAIPLLLVLATLAFSPENSSDKNATLKPATPAIEVIEVKPGDAANNLYYLVCAARTANDNPSGQFSASFKIKSKESKPVTLTNITYSYSSNGQTVLKIMVLDIDDLSKKKIIIPANGSFSWQNSRDYHEIDNAILLESPLPSSISIRLSFEGYADPFIITRSLKSYSNQEAGGAYSFPGKESDLRINEYWYSYGGHGGGSQFYAYDFKAIGWDSNKKEWRGTFPGKDGTENNHYMAYGKAIIAIADGKVVDFKDGVAENKGNGGGGGGGGNWFKINNGKETICYFHMQPGSLSKSLMKKGAIVKKGDKIGLLGNSGNSSEPHGHVQALDDPDADGDGDTRPLNFSNIYIIDKNKLVSPDPNAAWEKVVKQGLPFQEGRRCMIWPSAKKPCWYPSGKSEIAKHGIAEVNYQAEFNKVWGCGYYPVWVDAYVVEGKTYFNTIFRYNTNNYDVVVRHDMTKESYQSEYDEWVKNKGYRLQQVDNYNDAGKLKLAAIFNKKPGTAQAQPAYHAQTPEQHQTLFEKYTGEGYVPVNVSVTSVGGKRYYAAFYEKRSVGGAVLKSFLSQDEYQQQFDNMDKKKWEQVYINAYHHEGQTRFSVIWYKKSGFNQYTATRKSTSHSYQHKWEANTGNGLLTRCVTGYEEGGKHWFAAHWAK